LFCPAVDAAGSAFARYQSELGATVILIAAERYRRKTGQWPASIAAIDKSILPIVPLDPYSGGPFRMSRNDGKLLIYSIGPNRKDEGGVYEPERLTKGERDDVGAYAWVVSERRQKPTENQ
jgi:hypothetical protein